MPTVAPAAPSPQGRPAVTVMGTAAMTVATPAAYPATRTASIDAETRFAHFATRPALASAAAPECPAAAQAGRVEGRPETSRPASPARMTQGRPVKTGQTARPGRRPRKAAAHPGSRQ